MDTDNSNFTDDKRLFHFEKLQFQIEKEKFQIKQDKFEQDMGTIKDKLEIEQGRFQIRQDKFEQEMTAVKDKFEIEKAQFALEKEEFEMEKQQILTEKKQFDIEKVQFTLQKEQFETRVKRHLFDSSSLETFSITPYYYNTNNISNINSPDDIITTSTLVQPVSQQEHDQRPNETNILLTDEGKMFEFVQGSFFEHSEYNIQMFDSAMRTLRRMVKAVNKREADIERHLTQSETSLAEKTLKLEQDIAERSAKLEPFEEQLEQLRRDNNRLNRTFDQYETSVELTPIFAANTASCVKGNPQGAVLINIENLNKKIYIRIDYGKPLVEILWTDPITALFNILKKDWDNDKIPKVLDDTVKLFVSSSDVLIKGKKEWVQISGEGVELLPENHTKKITPQAFIKCKEPLQSSNRYGYGYHHSIRPNKYTFDNDQCSQGYACRQGRDPSCLYHCGSDIYYNSSNCSYAHRYEPFVELNDPPYLLHIKWSQ